MYKMPEFFEDDQQRVVDFMKANPFITLIGNHNGRSVATQVPVLFDEHDGKIMLRGHIMRKTDHHLAFEQNPEALVLFTGPHCHISASWYDKEKEHNIGSTWNYMTVHARGKMEFMDGAGTLQMITDLTHKYEAGKQDPVLVEHMPQEYVQGMVKAIAGFTLVLDDIFPIFKLSQNRNNVSYTNILKQLKATGRHDELQIAKEMTSRRPQLSND